MLIGLPQAALRRSLLFSSLGKVEARLDIAPDFGKNTHSFEDLFWRGVRVAEGAAFEMRSTGNRSGGSNPSLSVFFLA